MSHILKNKVAIVTGASRGIGAAIAERFAAEGAKVLITARTLQADGKLPGSLLETAERIRARGGQCHCVQADLSDPGADRARIVPETIAHFGRRDYLGQQRRVGALQKLRASKRAATPKWRLKSTISRRWSCRSKRLTAWSCAAAAGF